MKRLIKTLALAASLLLPAVVRADVLVATNDERFVGRLIEQTKDAVVFESEIGGRLTIPRTRIRDLQITSHAEPPAKTSGVAYPSPATNQLSTLKPQTTTNLMEWLPPGAGRGRDDWVQLKSGEWLKGQLKYVQNKEVEFDSDELEGMTLKLKDVRKAYVAEPVFTKFYGRDRVYGTVVISNDVVTVNGPERLSLNRDELTGITPGGEKEIKFWSGSLNTGVSFQSGNSKQTTVTTSAELARRTPATTLQIDYLGNFSEVNGTESANNNRVNSIYDLRINRNWFARAASLEYYRDPLANIGSRLTGGVGAGYYLFDRDDLEWTVAAGPSYQYTRFETVEPGQAETATTPAALIQSNFKADITSRLTLIENLSSTFTDREAGQYTHHSVTTLEFEIKHHLNLDVSYIWDYLKNPQAKSDGSKPLQSDSYLTVGFGVRF
jgi:putative salt-induced outer membrane protein YdiY